MSIDVSKYKKDSKQATTTKGSVYDMLNKDIAFFPYKLSDKKKENFYNQFYTLLNAGLDIKSTLELIEQEESKEKDKAVFSQIKNAIIEGATLTEAIQSSNQFSPYEYYSIQIGEKSGRLNQVLKELHIFFSKKIAQQRKIISVLSYPVFVLCIAFAVVYFMLTVVVPMFSDIYKQFGSELPQITKIIISLSDALANSSIYIFGSIIISIIVIISQKEQEYFRKLSSQLIINMPIWGPLARKIYLARFCQSMNLLISSKTPLVTSIELVQKMIGFYPMQTSLILVKEDLLNGMALNESLAKFPIYDKKLISLIKVGEEVNQLDAMFKQIAQQYNDEVEYQTQNIGNIIEPIMIVFLGIIVGLVLIAMYLPIFSLSSTIG